MSTAMADSSGGVRSAAVYRIDPRTGYSEPTFTWGLSGGETIAPDLPDRHVIPLTSVDGEQRWLVVHVPSVRRDNLNVLVVEDNLANAEYFRAVVEASDWCTAHVAHDGKSALEILRTTPVDLAFVDIRLPDANGFELARQFAATDLDHDLDVVLMSSDPRLANAPDLKAVGATAFLVNPVDRAVVQTMLEGALGRRGPLETQPPPTAPGTPSPSTPYIGLSFFGLPSLRVDARSVPLPRGRSREILAMLAASAPAPVTAERLVRYAWRSTSGASLSAVYTAVSRLRQALADLGAPSLIASTDGGYRLEIAPEAVDLVQFENAASQLIQSGDAARVEDVRVALEPWRSPAPFLNSGNEALNRWSHRLAEQRAGLQELLTRRLLDSGQLEEIPMIADELLEDEPWRESTWALLVVALYRSGRQKDALTRLEEGLHQLRDKMGLEPGLLLRRLELMILTHDPILGSPWSELVSRVARSD